MGKFKVGDTVRVVNVDDIHILIDDVSIGMYGKIIEDYGYGYYLALIGANHIVLNEHNIELINTIFVKPVIMHVSFPRELNKEVK